MYLICEGFHRIINAKVSPDISIEYRVAVLNKFFKGGLHTSVK